jgi:hypothetical protein
MKVHGYYFLREKFFVLLCELCVGHPLHTRAAHGKSTLVVMGQATVILRDFCSTAFTLS